MKKALVLLLVLAIAGGVAFAEAPAFSIGGEARIATRIDLAPVGSVDNVVLLDEDTYGKIDFTWDLNGYGVGLYFKTNPLAGGTYWDFNGNDDYDVGEGVPSVRFEIGINGAYEGDDYGFKVDVPVLRSLGAFEANDRNPFLFGNMQPNALWGYWSLFNDALLFDVSYTGGRDNNLWAVSSLVGGNVGTLDGASGIRLNFQGVPGLNVGMFFKGSTFGFDGAYINPDVVMIFKNMGIGVNYDLGFMALSLEGQLVTPWAGSGSTDDVDAEVFLGSKFDFGLITLNADLALYGLGRFGNKGRVDLGVGVDFTSGPLSVGAIIRFRDFMDNDNGYARYNYGGEIDLSRDAGYSGGRMVTVDPYVKYTISDNLYAQALFGFYVGLGDEEVGAPSSPSTKNEIGIAFEPLLAYFFKGGADGDDPANGMIFKYRLGYDIGALGEIIDNFFYIGFRWNF